jgi:hypothetical protein
MSTPASTLGCGRRRRTVDAIVGDGGLVRSHTDDAGLAYDIGTNLVLAQAEPAPHPTWSPGRLQRSVRWAGRR